MPGARGIPASSTRFFEDLINCSAMLRSALCVITNNPCRTRISLLLRVLLLHLGVFPSVCADRRAIRLASARIVGALLFLRLVCTGPISTCSVLVPLKVMSC